MCYLLIGCTHGSNEVSDPACQEQFGPFTATLWEAGEDPVDLGSLASAANLCGEGETLVTFVESDLVEVCAEAYVVLVECAKYVEGEPVSDSLRSYAFTTHGRSDHATVYVVNDAWVATYLAGNEATPGTD